LIYNDWGWGGGGGGLEDGESVVKLKAVKTIYFSRNGLLACMCTVYVDC